MLILVHKQKPLEIEKVYKTVHFFVVGRGGFEPPKSLTADLQSAYICQKMPLNSMISIQFCHYTPNIPQNQKSIF